MSFEEWINLQGQTMEAYIVFSCQMEAAVFIFQIFFAAHAVLKKGEYH